MKLRKVILSAIFILSVSLMFLGNAFLVSAEEDDSRICQGVFIDEVNVGGMTKEEAEEAVQNFVKDLQSKVLAVFVDENVVYTTLGELGYTNEANNHIEEALGFGQKGNLIKRYKDLKDIEHGGMVFPLAFKIDNKKIKEFIESQCSAYNINPVNAAVSRVNKQFVYTDHKVGRMVDINQTLELVENAVNENWNRENLVLQAVMAEDMPKYTREDVEKCNTLLGSFTTEYASSAEGRAANLANGARLINNTVLYPGDIFSSYEHLQPFNKSNGYYEAGAYQQGRVVDSIGGGACQVTTTLYNAVLFAELDIVERYAHSMTISYVDLSRDAAIAEHVKDFKFKNSSESPIVVEAYTVGRKITFNIWGNENRDKKNRRIEFVTVVLSETPPPADVITEDPNQPTTYRKVTQSAHRGYRAELYKVIYENNVEVSRQLVNKSTYQAAPRYITIGTKVVKPPKKEEEKPKKEVKENSNNVVLDHAPAADVYVEEEVYEDE